MAESFNLDRLRVVLVRTRNPLNVGAVARAMSNFGFSSLRVVAPYDVAYREARSAVGAPQLLQQAQEFPTVVEAVKDCSLVVGTTAMVSRKAVHALRPLEEGASVIRERLGSSPVALLFGSEKRGLSNDDLSHCHWLMRISMRDPLASMNLGQAAAVCLYELARTPQESLPARPSVDAADAEALERMTQALFGGLLASGYVKVGAETVSLEKARRLVLRAQLDNQDAETWTGMLSKMALGLQNKKSQKR